YQSLVESGALRPDKYQTHIIQTLQGLHDRLITYGPPVIAEPAASFFISRLLSRNAPVPGGPPESAPKGLYLFGDVGTGKTMLMDLFYSTLPRSIDRKRRVHFHAFMVDVHKRIHAVKKVMGHGGDPIPPVVRDLAKEAYVLCFDEFQVTDIADAMILRRLLEGLVNYGVVCVITSKHVPSHFHDGIRHPDDLYKNGIQRSSFIPAIDLLKCQFDVQPLDSGTDYRKIPRALSRCYFHPINEENTLEINKLFKSMTSGDPSDPVVHNRPIHTWGRSFLVPESTSHVARFRFEDVCGKPLSPADYIEITRTFNTIFLLDVPKMTLNEKDMARRFINFIDACYESKIRLFVTSEAPIYQVFSDNDDKLDNSDELKGALYELGLGEHQVGKSSMFSGSEEIFAFARACSRLVQMGSKEWAETTGP
ncbi:AFG1-like ATPase, partial [Fistulina hepatica ATCC 64428]